MTKFAYLFLLAMLLTSCVRQLPHASMFPTPSMTSLSPVEASPTAPPATPTSEPPTPTANELPVYFNGLEVVKARHQEAYPFVFLYDPYVWQSGDGTNCPGCMLLLEFTHRQLPDCGFQVNPGTEFAALETAETQLGNRTWRLGLDEGGERIHYQSAWADQYHLDIVAKGTGDPLCRSDVEAVLAETRFTWEVFAGRLPSGLPTPAPMPLPQDYACNSLPARLRIGDTAQVIVDSVWVRSEPRRSEDTKILLLYKDAALSLIINAGPICAEGLTFWNVRYYAGSEYSGWVAEGDDQEYFLEAVLP